jgi:hypothetical protein
LPVEVKDEDVGIASELPSSDEDFELNTQL